MDEYREMCPLEFGVSGVVFISAGKVLSVFVFAVADLNARAPTHTHIVCPGEKSSRTQRARRQSVNKRSEIIIIVAE